MALEHPPTIPILIGFLKWIVYSEIFFLLWTTKGELKKKNNLNLRLSILMEVNIGN